jgi:anti-sigma factor RsiW
VTEPISGHVDLDRLAELDAELLSEPEAAAVEAHLHDCIVCNEQLSAIRATRSALAALPAVPMPAAVAARLEETLAGAAGTATVVPVLTPRPSRWFQRPTGAGLAAAAVVAALVGAVVVGSAVKDDGSQSGDIGAAGALEAPERSTPAYPVFASGTVYTEANARKQVSALEDLAGLTVDQDSSAIAPQGSVVLDAQPSDVPAATRAMFVSSEELLTCVAKLTAGGPSVLPVAVDFVRWTDPGHDLRHVPAVAIVLPQQVGTKDGLFVVGPDCTTSPTQNIYLFAAVS